MHLVVTTEVFGDSSSTRVGCVISLSPPPSKTPRRDVWILDRSDWGWVTGLVPSSAVGQAMPGISPTAGGTPRILTSRASWLFTRSSPGLIHERGNLTL